MDIESNLKEIETLLTHAEQQYGKILSHQHYCTILSQSAISVEFMVNTGNENYLECSLLFDMNDHIVPVTGEEQSGWNRYTYACLLQWMEELKALNAKTPPEHKQYSREGMIKRVLEERQAKTLKANYHIKWADNIYGDHLLTNERGVKYKIFLRDFKNKTGYSDSADAKFNKLGTTKHIMFAFDKLLNNNDLYNSLGLVFPFVEIYCDPLNEYKISWFYPHELGIEEQLLIYKYFGKSTFIEENQVAEFLHFIQEATSFDSICIRPEVQEKVARCYEQLMLSELREKVIPEFTGIKAEMFPYQQEGVKFTLFKKAAIIADEMGLGKTLQAISAAILKKQIFGFTKTLVVCPATLKSQWKKEIEHFSGEKAIIVSGYPQEREKQYLNNEAYFLIVNYETVLRDSQEINKAGFDFLILDEAQKVKNYETKTSSAIRRIKPKHTLVITGTPIENRLIDIFSIVNVIDPYFFGPLWEFSYQHCLFDTEKLNKINGYYDLDKLNEKLAEILIRREKNQVLDQLPNVQQIDIRVELSPLQSEYHGSYMSGLSKIVRKKFLTPFDLQQIMLLMSNARMVCDSSFLIDEETNESPKLDKLKEMLFEKLDIKNNPRKIIIFSEWIKVHKLIGQILREEGIGFVELNGKIPVKLRGDLIKKFENNDDCQIFLSTEAGGSGLNLQVANTLINFELPWNPAKKNQRIGRIDRLGQKSNKLTVYNLITRASIEESIAAGLLVKQNLFDSVLSEDKSTTFVDFSSKGRSQFIKQIEALLSEQENFAKTQAEEYDNEVIADLKPEAMIDATQLDLFEQSMQNAEEPVIEELENTPIAQNKPIEKQAVELEQVMNSGMQFLAGLFKMSTGQEMNIGNQKIEIDKNTGEVVMRFRIPQG